MSVRERCPASCLEKCVIRSSPPCSKYGVTDEAIEIADTKLVGDKLSFTADRPRRDPCSTLRRRRPKTRRGIVRFHAEGVGRAREFPWGPIRLSSPADGCASASGPLAIKSVTPYDSAIFRLTRNRWLIRATYLV